MKKIFEHLMFSNYSYYIQDVFTGELDELKKEVFFIQSTDPGVERSNFGGWQSKNIINEDIYENISVLKDEMLVELKNIYDRWEITSHPKILGMWCNINNKHDFNLPHRHPGSLFSAVFYVDCQQDSGKIVFERSDQFEDYFSAQVEHPNKYTFSNYTFAPDKNSAIFFPSHLKHFVEPNMSEKSRISIAFNFM